MVVTRGKDKKNSSEEKFTRARFNTANPASYGVIKNFRTELKKKPTKTEDVLWYF